MSNDLLFGGMNPEMDDIDFGDVIDDARAKRDQDENEQT